MGCRAEFTKKFRCVKVQEINDEVNTSKALEMYFLESLRPKLGFIFKSDPCISESKCSQKLPRLRLVHHLGIFEKHTFSKIHKSACTSEAPLFKCQESEAACLLGTFYKPPGNLSAFLCV